MDGGAVDGRGVWVRGVRVEEVGVRWREEGGGLACDEGLVGCGRGWGRRGGLQNECS